MQDRYCSGNNSLHLLGNAQQWRALKEWTPIVAHSQQAVPRNPAQSAPEQGFSSLVSYRADIVWALV